MSKFLDGDYCKYIRTHVEITTNTETPLYLYSHFTWWSKHTGMCVILVLHDRNPNSAPLSHCAIVSTNKS